MTLGVTGSLSLLIRPAPLWLHLFQLQSFAYMYLLNYSVNVWLTSGKPYKFLHGTLTYVMIILTCLVSFFAYRSRPNYGHLLLNDPVQPTALYAAYYGLALGAILIAELQIIRLFVRSIVQSKDLTYIIRRSVGLFAMLCVTIGTCAAAVNLVLFMRYDTTYRTLLNMVFYVTTPMITLLPLINAVNRSTLERIAAPLDARRARRERQQRERLHYLHRRITTITPQVVLRHDALLQSRILMELSHARQIIWSYTRRSMPVSAKIEAAHVFALLANENVLESSGPYTAPRPWARREKQHFVAVAMQLAHLERRPDYPEQEVTHDA
jgi:hypothetical protein